MGRSRRRLGDEVRARHPNASATIVTAYRPHTGKGARNSFLCLRQIQRVTQDLILQRLFAQQPLQLAHLLLKGPVP
jgi:hypothetical protein